MTLFKVFLKIAYTFSFVKMSENINLNNSDYFYWKSGYEKIESPSNKAVLFFYNSNIFMYIYFNLTLYSKICNLIKMT